MVIPYIRHDGIWKMDANLYNYGGPIYKPTNMIMEDVGLVSGISDVTKKNTQLASGSQSGFPAAQPKHGYMMTEPLLPLPSNTNFIRNICNDSGIKSLCHSEERSDEESAFLTQREEMLHFVLHDRT